MRHLSSEHKRKISAANKGKKFSDEHRRKIGIAHKGRVFSEETLKKMSQAGKNKTFSKEHRRKLSKAGKGENNFFYGKHHSVETKQKLSEMTKGEKNGNYDRRHSEETKRKISEANKGRKRSEWHKKKVGEAARERRKTQVFPLKDTKIEVRLQEFLKLLGIEFIPHGYMKIKHGYQYDILIPSMNVVLEADGNYWHKYPIGNDIDKIRTKELIEKGFKVLRLWESEINIMNLEEFKTRLSNIM